MPEMSARSEPLEPDPVSTGVGMDAIVLSGIFWWCVTPLNSTQYPGSYLIN